MTAGKALDKDNVAGYNCGYLAVDSPRAFDEAMYILMCGTGVGFSVERQFINQLPVVPEELHDSGTPIHVRDSKIGWRLLIENLSPSYMQVVYPDGTCLKFDRQALGSKLLVAAHPGLKQIPKNFQSLNIKP